MTHERIKELLPLYIDNGLTEKETEIIKAHLKQCPECQKELEEYQENHEFLASLEKEEVPSGFSKSILRKVRKDMKDEKKDIYLLERFRNLLKKPVKVPAGVIGLAAVVLLVIISSLGYFVKDDPIQYKYESQYSDNEFLYRNDLQFSGFEPEFSTTPEAAKMRTMSMDQVAGSASLLNTADFEQKLIKRAILVIETNNIDNIDTDIASLVQSYNGYISNSRNWLNGSKQKFFWFELRLPANNFNQILEDLSKKEYGQLISRNISTQDVTEEYLDINIRLENLLAQENRYRQLLDRAVEVEEILEIEKELNRVRIEIERLQGRKNYLDNQIAYSTITVEFRQPEPISSGTPGIIKALRSALTKIVDHFYLIIIILGTLIPYLILIMIIYLLYRYRKKYRKSD
ncbi:MAG: DUF4349 domain-containing protein [Halanaerobiaceae bacterium]|jgi:hypothetical protein|nr:DUF4349 domain-containing protein [Halanaerobiaceae bacterium]